MPRANQGPLGPALRKFRESRDESGKEFAAMTGMSQGHLSEIETGRRKLTDALVERIAAAVKMQPDDLLDQLDSLSGANADPESIYLRDDTPTYNARVTPPPTLIPPDYIHDLAEIMLEEMASSDRAALLRKLTESAIVGDQRASRAARGLLLITEKLTH